MSYRDRPGQPPGMRDDQAWPGDRPASGAARNGVSRPARSAPDPSSTGLPPWRAPDSPAADRAGSGRPPSAARRPRDDASFLGTSDPRDPTRSQPGSAGGSRFTGGSAASHTAGGGSAAFDDPVERRRWPDRDVAGAGGRYPAYDDGDDLPVEAGEPIEATAPAPERRRARQARAATSARRRAARPRSAPALPRLTVPGFIAQSSVAADRVMLGILGVSLFGLAVMAAAMASRLGSLHGAVVIHLDAAGQPDRWGPPKTLWRLPLMATMLTALNLVGAWFVAPRDLFAGRFLLATALGAQIIVWVAVLRFLW